MTGAEEIVLLRRIARLAQAMLISPYNREHADELALALREYEEGKRWRPTAA